MMKEILELSVGQLLGGAAGTIILLSIFIEITPIKVNPISHFLAWFGRKINKDMLEKFEKLEMKVIALETSLDESNERDKESDAITRRVRILRFGDEIRLGQKHSQEGYDQVLDDIDHYEQYCHEHPLFKNNKTVITTKTIKDEYRRCSDENDFL